ncbi:protein BASIC PENTACYSTEINE3-like isoform X2 [Bidens hawaiensis]|uniref:protein BASIC PENTACYSTEINE3-like isoform X2 n=1 Tax=Bidens hawaiensis TaxID=980011 RepID=UPI004049EDCA
MLNVDIYIFYTYKLTPISTFSFSLLSPDLNPKKTCLPTDSMDDDGLNIRNWGYYEPSFKEHLGLQLMSPIVDHRDQKPFIPNRDNPLMVNPNVSTYHHPHTRVVSDPPVPMNYMTDGWIQRERLLHVSHPIHMVPPLDLCKDPVINMNVDDNVVVNKDVGGSGSATGAAKPSRSKKPKKGPTGPKERVKTIKRGVEVVINGIDMDISGILIPVCTCTGAPQQCYRWGLGGWQSACCTTTISMYPLPMSTKRRGARIAGRKMSQGAFKKVLEKLASEGYNFANAIDLRSYWAKHGTNKFVTIR